MIRLLVSTLARVAAFFLAGFVIEWLTASEKKRGSIYFNCACTVLYHLSAVTLGALITAQLARFALYLPFRGVFDFSQLSDRRLLLAGIPVAFGWLAVQDFFYYWMHRLQHTSKWLWAEHEVHHSDEHLNVTTTFRHHWLEPCLQAVFMGFPMGVLFRPPAMLAVSAYVVSNFYSSFIHLNSRITLGPLNPLFANPSTHRIHHSKLPQHVDKNFAAYCPLWDVLFATYCAPTKEGPPTGLAYSHGISSIERAITHPFRKWLRFWLTGFSAQNQSRTRPDSQLRPDLQ